MKYQSSLTEIRGASFDNISILCLRGLAVQTISTPGFIGIVELDSVSLEVSRNRTVGADVSNVLDNARKGTISPIINNLDLMGGEGANSRQDVIS
jgi:hypothetical protein